jgi:transcriptional regulator with XRE-family HTH domain
MTQPLGEPTLGSRLRGLRGSAPQRSIAEAIGVRASSISGYENGTLLPPEVRLRNYATYAVARRAGGRGRIPAEDELKDTERSKRDELLDELMGLRDAAAQQSDSTEDLWTFPAGEPVRLVSGQLQDVVHPYADIRNPNYTDLLSFADLDALVELLGHVRMRNPKSDVRLVRADRLVAADNLSSHIVMIGGPGLNVPLQQIFEGTSLPVTQRPHPKVENGEVFHVEGQKEPSLPVFTGDPPRLIGDIGIFARLTNPFNSLRTLTWCSGVFSRGVYGAVRLLSDADLRDQNGAYLAERFSTATQFAVLTRVPVVLGGAITPDLQNDEARLYEWSDAEEDRRSRPDRPAATRR